MTGARRIYRWLLKLYPAGFREEYARPMEQQFADDYGDAHGAGRVLLWFHALADLALSIPAELARELNRDLAFAARVYRRNWLASSLALATLALAIGVSTGVFSVVNALLLRGLPFRDPARLVQMENFAEPPALAKWCVSSRYIADAALYAEAEASVSGPSGAVRVKLAETTANFFTVLGGEPQFGRGFAGGEDTEGHDAIAVIGYGLWQQMFGGDAHVLGSVIRLNGQPAVIVGVAPPAFDFPARTAVWTPTAGDLTRIPKESSAMFHVNVARLRPGVSLSRANEMYRAEMAREFRDPKDLAHCRLTSLRDQLAGPVRQASLVLLAAALFVLLIACANVAHLLLSRVTERRPELLVRTALGASRARLVQQLITESMLLTFLAAAAGMLVAYGATRVASVLEPARLAAQSYTLVDWRVLAFAMGIAALTGVVFGVLPASLTSRLQGQRMMPGRGLNRLRGVLLAMQAALAVMLISGSATMIRSFLELMHTPLGMQTDHVITLTTSVLGSAPDGKHRQRQYFEEVARRLRSIPGVEAVGGVEYLPLQQQSYGLWRYRLDSGEQSPGIPIGATPGYFRAAGIRLLAGRDFTESDQARSLPVAVVNAELVRGLGSPAAVLGMQLTPSYGAMKYTIVGVVETARAAGPDARFVDLPEVFLPVQQRTPQFLTFLARVHGDAASYLPLAQDRVRAIDPGVAVHDVKTLDRWFEDAVARPRFYTTSVAFFGAFAMLLALIGIYGVASYSIAQRTHEIGVRLAVGASSDRLRAMLLRQGLVPVAAGVAAGLAGASLLGSFLQHLMRSAKPLSGEADAMSALLLGSTAALAVWTATRRIVKMDPMRILRAE